MPKKQPTPRTGASSLRERGLKAILTPVTPEVADLIAKATEQARPADHKGRWSAAQWCASVLEKEARKVLGKIRKNPRTAID